MIVYMTEVYKEVCSSHSDGVVVVDDGDDDDNDDDEDDDFCSVACGGVSYRLIIDCIIREVFFNSLS